MSDVLDGYNGTVFAYGQTGSGKTFTMMVRDCTRSVFRDSSYGLGRRHRLRRIEGDYPTDY